MNVGLIGYGRWGKNVARAIARVADLTVIVEPNADRLTDAAATWTPWGTVVTTDINEAYSRCDAVWIATPADTHRDVAALCLEERLHVMVEKPFVMNTEDAVALCTQAAENDLAIMVGHLSLHTAEWGEIASFNAPQDVSTFRRNTEPSLSDHSVLWGLGPHDVATVVTLMGEPDTVNAHGTRHRVVAGLGWEDGRTAIIELDWLALAKDRGVVSLSVEGRAREWRGGDVDDSVEPLLAEAGAFVRLCKAGWRGGGNITQDGKLDERWRRQKEAIAVTRTLARIERAMA